MRIAVAILIAMHCLALSAGEIRLPIRKVSVTPEPIPGIALEPVETLSTDEWYIVDSDAELICLSSPSGVIEIEPLTGPMTFRGRFAGGTKVETRKFPGPYLYAVTAVVSGKAELIIVPVGVTAESEVTRVMLTVSGPRPPPKPDPIPDPKPDPPKPDPKPAPLAKHVSIAIVEDTMNRSPDTAILMNQMVAWTAFVDSGNDWRAYDLKTSEAKGKRAIADLNGPVPGIVIYDKETRVWIYRGAMPATFDDLKSLIGRLTGG